MPGASFHGVGGGRGEDDACRQADITSGERRRRLVEEFYHAPRCRRVGRGETLRRCLAPPPRLGVATRSSAMARALRLQSPPSQTKHSLARTHAHRRSLLCLDPMSGVRQEREEEQQVIAARCCSPVNQDDICMAVGLATDLAAMAAVSPATVPCEKACVLRRFVRCARCFRARRGVVRAAAA